VTDIPKNLEEGESMLTVPPTPERDITKEDLPWYWKEEEVGPPQPRTPEEAIQRRYQAGIARTIEDLQDQSPRPKRIKTPPQDSDDSSEEIKRSLPYRKLSKGTKRRKIKL